MKRLKILKNSIRGTAKIPRITAFRSLKHILAQAIDDEKGHTLAYISDQKFSEKNPTEKAQRVGQELAKALKKQAIKQARFDKGNYKYHGRIKALVEALRQEGVKI